MQYEEKNAHAITYIEHRIYLNKMNSIGVA